MKAISLWQPWAAAIVFGVKRNETRSWATSYRGMLAIHAAKRRTQAEREAFHDLLSDSPESMCAFEDHLALDFDALPFGALVGIAELVDCTPTLGLRVGELEDRWGNYQPGRYAWRFSRVWRLRDPVPCVGRQQLFDVDDAAVNTAGADLVEAFQL